MSTQSLMRLSGAIGSVVCLQCFLVSVAVAAGPAVSAPNAKFDLKLGGSSDASVIAGAGASVTLPVGDAVGVQADFSVQDYDLLTGTAALHVFTRDPSSYLVGVTAGIVKSDVSLLDAVGVEGELYLDRISLEAWAGYAKLDYALGAGADKSGVFAMGDVAYYPTDDLRLSVGLSSVLGYESVNFGAEYQPTDLGLPLSFTADARLGEDGKFAALGGVKFHLGESDKSLIARHRQDDPPDRGLDLFAAAGSQVNNRPVLASDFTDAEACIDAGFDWLNGSNGEYCG